MGEHMGERLHDLLAELRGDLPDPLEKKPPLVPFKWAVDRRKTDGGTCDRVVGANKCPIVYHPRLGQRYNWERRKGDTDLEGPWLLWPIHRLHNLHYRPWEPRFVKKFARCSKDKNGHLQFEPHTRESIEELAMTVGPLGRNSFRVEIAEHTGVRYGKPKNPRVPPKIMLDGKLVQVHSSDWLSPGLDYIGERLSDWQDAIREIAWLEEFIYALSRFGGQASPGSRQSPSARWPGAECRLSRYFDIEEIQKAVESDRFIARSGVRMDFDEAMWAIYDRKAALAGHHVEGYIVTESTNREIEHFEGLVAKAREKWFFLGGRIGKKGQLIDTQRPPAKLHRCFLGTSGYSPCEQDSILAGEIIGDFIRARHEVPAMAEIAERMVEARLTRHLVEGSQPALTKSSRGGWEIITMPKDQLGYIHALLGERFAGRFRVCARDGCGKLARETSKYCSDNCRERNSKEDPRHPERRERANAKARERMMRRNRTPASQVPTFRDSLSPTNGNEG